MYVPELKRELEGHDLRVWLGTHVPADTPAGPLLQAALVERREKVGRWLAEAAGLPVPPNGAATHPLDLSPAKPPAYPPLWRRAWNYLRSATRHVLHGRPPTPEQVRAKRLALCLACEHYDRAGAGCTKCGCPAGAKISWALEKCPVGKW